MGTTLDGTKEHVAAIPQKDTARDSITILAQQAIGLSPNALCRNLRGLLGKILSMQNGNVQASTEWLRAPNNALGNCSPVVMIQQGRLQEVLTMWKGYERQHTLPGRAS